jgi:hypothetical protein
MIFATISEEKNKPMRFLSLPPLELVPVQIFNEVLDLSSFFLHGETYFSESSLFAKMIKRCWGSVTFWCGSGSGSTDPYLLLLDLTPFFNNFKDAKKLFFSYFILITYPQAHYLQS